jgi:hypothetical protein
MNFELTTDHDDRRPDLMDAKRTIIVAEGAETGKLWQRWGGWCS